MSVVLADPDLPAIGSVWKFAYRPEPHCSTRWWFDFWSYDVVDHSVASDGLFEYPTATLEPIDVERVPPVGHIIFNGKIWSIPPRWLTEFCDQDTKAIVRGIDGGMFPFQWPSQPPENPCVG